MCARLGWVARRSAKVDDRGGSASLGARETDDYRSRPAASSSRSIHWEAGPDPGS